MRKLVVMVTALSVLLVGCAAKNFCLYETYQATSEDPVRQQGGNGQPTSQGLGLTGWATFLRIIPLADLVAKIPDRNQLARDRHWRRVKGRRVFTFGEFSRELSVGNVPGTPQNLGKLYKSVNGLTPKQTDGNAGYVRGGPGTAISIKTGEKANKAAGDGTQRHAA